MIRGFVYLTGLVTLALVACVAGVAYKVHEWPWREYIREGSEVLADKLDPRTREAALRERLGAPAAEAAPLPGDAARRGAGEGWPGEVPAGPAERVVRHTVARGDTLYALSRSYYGDPLLWRGIARANDIRRPSDLKVGRVIVIPPPHRGEGTTADAGSPGEVGTPPGGGGRFVDLSLALAPAFEAGAEGSGTGRDLR